VAEPIAPALAQRIRLVVLDVDGVMTDGGIYLGATDAGERVELKRFDIQDGLGIRLVREAGIKVAIVTGRESHAVRLRAEELEVDEVHQDRSAAKLKIVEAMLERLGIGWDETAFMGDDLPDLAVMRRCGFAVAVANAVDAVKEAAHYVTRASGGRGAVREFCDLVLAARAQLDTVRAV